MTKRALFLDRDGVINVDHGYVHRREDMDFIDGIFELVAAAGHAGYLVVVVTNQSGIGRGYFTEADFNALTSWMRDQFAQRGGMIDAVYHCPFHPTEGQGKYRQESAFRKPGPGMILQAGRDLDLDLAASLLVGDSPGDIQAGATAGVGRLFYVGSGPLPEGARGVTSLREIIPLL